MSYDLAPLKSYVRFYLAIVSQLERVWQSLVSIETAIRDELGPYAADLAPVPLTAIATLTDPPRPLPPEVAALWRPEDEAELDALCDVYEVVGRFAFQGDADTNLARVTDLVDQGRAAARENDDALQALSPLFTLAKETAQRLRSEEAARAAKDRAERSDKLEPMIETVLLRAKQTLDALHAVPLPPLEDAASASEDYKKLRAKMQQVYQTCLPFMKNAIDKVWAFVGAPVPQAFPEELPLVPELPPELLTVGVTGSEELERAEKTLAALAEEAEGLKRTKEEIAGRLVKLESDVSAAVARRDDNGTDIEFATTLLDWVRTTEQVAGYRARADELERELSQRVARTSQFTEAAGRLTAELDTEAKGIAEAATALETLTKEVTLLREDAPFVFGKDDWRKKVAAADTKVEEDRNTLTQRTQVHAQRRVELSAAEVHVQTAQAEQAIVERSLADVRGRAMEAEKAVRALSEKLGTKRPSRLVPASEVEEILGVLETKQQKIDADLDRLRGEQKRFKEDGIRTLTRERQIDVERQQFHTRIESSKVARAEGLDAAYKSLAVERKTAVEEHVREVLEALSKSLVQVGTVFVDPARELMRKATEPDYDAAERVAKAAEAVAPVVARLLAERSPELASVEELLNRIRKEFCEAAASACRAAWG